jgi:hypothetical protein
VLSQRKGRSIDPEDQFGGKGNGVKCHISPEVNIKGRVNIQELVLVELPLIANTYSHIGFYPVFQAGSL